MSHYDVIVVGIGGMGSAATHHLAARGLGVLGLERYDIPHAMGSSHGINRIIRMAYYEDASYVPLLRRAYELWRELERSSGERLLVTTGGLDCGPEDSTVFSGSLRSCLEHGLEHDVLTGPEVNRRFPGYRLPAEHLAVFQPEGGYVMAERCIVAHVVGAQRHGADVRAREAVLGWEPVGDGVRVATDRGVYTAERLVVTAGAWTLGLIERLAGALSPERQVLAWFQPLRPELFQPDVFPIFVMNLSDGGHFYGFPVETIPGFKVGMYHHLREAVDPDTMDREPGPADEAPLRDFTDRYFPDAAGPTMTLKTCMFTNSPDEHFIVDLHPEFPQVAVAAGFSGHGFKFASVIGEILADLATDGVTGYDIDLLRWDRPGVF
jgi:sarcosine oxidase